MELIVLEWSTGAQKKLENGIKSEDCAVWDTDKGYFIVADGVSRDSYDTKGFSLAREAAERAAHAMARSLSKSNSEHAMYDAFKQANEAVKALNEEAGLWGESNNNYLDRDLAGTCLACMVQRKGEFSYGYVGDSRIAHLTSGGNLFITPDQVLEAKAEFPQGKHTEQVVTIRKERRNNPSDPHKTYGVLTGEDAALDPTYLKLGSYKCNTGDVVLVCSDGLASFVENDKQFTQLLLSGSKEKIQAYVADPDSPYQNNDERTLILYRV